MSAPSADQMKRWLAAVASDQDRAAFGELFRFFAPRVASFMQRGGLSPSEAEDIAQETMVAVWRKAALYDPAQAGVSTWIFTIARNLRIDRARKDRRAGRKRRPRIRAGGTGKFRRGRDPRHRTGRQRPARPAEPVAGAGGSAETVVFSEKPHAQIARELNIPLGTVKSRARLAMARIRAILEQEQ